MIKDHHWNCAVEFDCDDYHSFVYRISFDDGRFYIGKKDFHAGKNWRKYKSSSKAVKNILESEDAVFTITHLCMDRRSATFAEMAEIAKSFLSDKCINENVLGRFYKGSISGKIIDCNKRIIE